MPGGRPPKLTPESEAEFLRRLATGVPRRVAAASIGVDRTTVELWLKCGREGHKDKRYKAFLDKVVQVESEVELLLAGSIVRAAQGDPNRNLLPDWKAAAWFLERRHGKTYGKKDVLGLGLVPGMPRGVNGHRPKGAYTLKLEVVRAPHPKQE